MFIWIMGEPVWEGGKAGVDVGSKAVGVVVGVIVGVGVVGVGVGVVTEFPQPVAKTIRAKRSALLLTRVLRFIPHLSMPY